MFGWNNWNKQPGIQCVDELAGPQDYWMTFKEVARHKHAYMATVRHWVNCGFLPVKRDSVHVDSKHPVNLHQGEPLVRLSDVQRIRDRF